MDEFTNRLLNFLFHPGFILFALPGVYLLVRGYFKIVTLNKIKTYGLASLAEITEKSYRSSRSYPNNSPRVYWPKYKFKFVDYKGSIHSGAFELFGFVGRLEDILEDDSYNIKDKIEVLYLKEKPKYCYPKNEIDQCLGALNKYYYYGSGLLLFGIFATFLN